MWVFSSKLSDLNGARRVKVGGGGERSVRPKGQDVLISEFPAHFLSLMATAYDHGFLAVFKQI